MLKTYHFKTVKCKGDIHSSKTANILPGLMTEYWWMPLRVHAK